METLSKKVRTIIRPRGKMTKPLTTSYSVGDVVMLTTDLDAASVPRPDTPRPGETGTIRRIVISDPHDGDDTFLLFVVKFAGRTRYLSESEIAPATKANRWLLRQLATLNVSFDAGDDE